MGSYGVLTWYGQVFGGLIPGDETLEKRGELQKEVSNTSAVISKDFAVIY